MSPHRKKPFSGKAKKQQLKEKRERVRTRQEADDDAIEPSPSSPHLQTNTLIPLRSGRDGRRDLRTIVEQEPRHVIEARKMDATRPLAYGCNRGFSHALYASGVHEWENQPELFKKPAWHREMTMEQLEQSEDKAYLTWIAALKDAEAQRQDKCRLNLFERNIEVWRELWRVIELSSVVVHLADARLPLLHVSHKLVQYIQESFPQKRIVMVLTKTDLVQAERVNEWVSYLQDSFEGIPVIPYNRDNTEESNGVLMHTIGQMSEDVQLQDCHGNDSKTLSIGFVGEPNVGKSSLLNALFQRKLVSVSATPGHTKHLQTHFFDRVEMLHRGDEVEKVVVCDCPGIVFPRFAVPLALQILFGSYPIAHTREPFSAIRFIAENCCPSLDEVYGLVHVDSDDKEWTPYGLCEAYAKLRGFHVKGGKYDVHRAANQLLRDTLNGKRVVLSFPPPPVVV